MRKRVKRGRHPAKTPEKDRSEGYIRGWEQGCRYGSSRAVLNRLPAPAFGFFEKRVLFVQQGFEAIDAGIQQGLAALTRELIVCAPEHMLQTAAASRPDMMLVLNGLHVFPEDHLAQADGVRGLGIRTAIWFADDPYFMDLTPAIVPHYDYIFTHERNAVAYYRSLGCERVYHLPLAAAGHIYYPQPAEPSYLSDVCFIGNAFPNRIDFIDALAPALTGRKVVLIGALWDRLKHYKQFRRGIHLGWKPMDEAAKYYNGARIVLNLHRAPLDPVYSKNKIGLPAGSINPRSYEIAACGSFQLTDLRGDLAELYTPGAEIETFTSPQDCAGKLLYYLRNEERRREIAVRGLMRTRASHSFEARLSQLLQIVFG
ncbi:glycosyltransferase [Paenibacillus chitinolyticus]|uniref:CgeB family protein n=1 Tax=Paenibacillus chitinolyticus TaxID=79263 RepID=UPI003556B72D